MKKFKNLAFRIGDQVKIIQSAQLADLPPGIVLIGLPEDKGIKNVGGRMGAKLGPTAIREKLFKLVAPALTIPVYDIGNLNPSHSLEETHTDAQKQIEALHSYRHIPLVLGGSHDLAFPEAAALLKAQSKGRAGFLNVDAHLDLRPPNAQGITSGSPWYLLLQETAFHKRKCSLVEFGIQPHCNAPELLQIATDHKVKIHWLSNLKRATQQFQSILKALAKSHGTLQVSLDIDSVQSSQAPGCSAPQVLGFTAADFIRFSELAGAERKVRSFGIYEVSPPLDFDGHTAALAAQAALAFIHGMEKRRS